MHNYVYRLFSLWNLSPLDERLQLSKALKAVPRDNIFGRIFLRGRKYSELVAFRSVLRHAPKIDTAHCLLLSCHWGGSGTRTRITMHSIHAPMSLLGSRQILALEVN